MGLFKTKTIEQLNNEENYRKMTPGQRIAHYYGIEDLDEFNIGIINDIAKDLKLERLGNMGALLSGNDAQRLHDLQILSGIQIQQNWILIRQLNEITKLISSGNNNSSYEQSPSNGLPENDKFASTSESDSKIKVEVTTLTDFLKIAESCKTAKEVYDYSIEYSKTGIISKELNDSIKNIYLSERLYGNMHTECIKKIGEFLDK